MQRVDGAQVCIVISKRGRDCRIGKLVLARPLGELVLAFVYHNRPAVGTVSLPPRVLDVARERGARLWVVRSRDGSCVALPLADVERRGWLNLSDGQPEYFVPLEKFSPIQPQVWPYCITEIRLGDGLPVSSLQPSLFGEAMP